MIEPIKSDAELQEAQGIVLPDGDGGKPKNAPAQIDTQQSSVFGTIAKINKSNPITKPSIDQGFQQAEQVLSPISPNANQYKLPEYRDYLDNPNPDDPTLDVQRAQAQPWYEQLRRATGQLLIGGLGGFVQAAGTNLDVKQTADMLNGSETEYGNALTKAGEDLINWSKQAMPIYQEKQGQFNPSDPGWWFDQIGSSGAMVGMAGEAVAETGLITAATEGTGTGEEIGNLANRLGRLSKLIGIGSNTERMRASAVLFGLINRHNMGMMSANQTGQEEYQNLIDKGYSEEDARTYASKAAAATYLGNIPLVALDILGFKAMTFNPITRAAEGGLADTILENTIGHINNPLLKNAAILGIESAKGGFEAAWQYLASANGRRYADSLTQGSPNDSNGEALNNYFKLNELLNSAASGGIGGLVTGGLFKGYEKMTQGSAKHALDEEYKTFINNFAQTHLELGAAIKEAEQDGNEGEANILRRQLGINKALAAVHLDNMKGEDAAFNSYKSYFQGVLNSVNDGEDISKLGLTGHEDFLKQNIPLWLKDADHIKSIYDDAKEYNKPNAVVPVTYRRYLIDNLNEELVKTNGQILATEASMPDLANLSQTAKQSFDSQLQLKLFEARQANAEREIVRARNAGDEEKVAELQGIIDHAIYAQDFHQDVLNRNQDAKGNFSDTDILQALNTNGKLKQLQEQKALLESTLVGIRKQLNLWQDPKFQSAKKQSQLANIISKADTVKDIDRITNAMHAQGEMTDELQAQINDKSAKLQAKEEAETLKNKAKAPDNPVNEGLSPIQQAMRQTGPKPPPVTTDEDNINPFGKPAVYDEDNDKHFMFSEARKGMAADLTNITSTPNATVVKTPDIFSEPDPEPKKADPTPEGLINDDIISKFFAPASVNEDKLTDEVKGKLRDKITDYINSLKQDLGKEPSFSDLVQDFIRHTSKEDAEHNFNLIKTGWELTGKKATDYSQVYNDLFGDRKAKGYDFFEVGNSVLATTPEELKTQNDELTSEQDKRDAPPEQFTQTESGEKQFVHLTPYQTVSPDLKLAHLSFPYIRHLIPDDKGNTLIDYEYHGSQPNEGQYVDSKELMNPNKYQPGTKLYARVPSNFEDMLISNWDEHWNNLPAVKFADWAKGKDVNSDDYIGRLPVLIHNEEGKPVAFVHDTQWYNPVNIGFVDSTDHQNETISLARKNILDLKKSLLDNDKRQLELTITNKSIGTKYTIPEDKPLVTIKQANPHAEVGYVNRVGQLVTSSGIYNPEQLINKSDLSIGHKYDIRQASIDEGGKPTYYASKVMYDTITPDAKMSIIQALRTYASQFDEGENLSKKGEVTNIRKEILDKTGLDLFTPQGIEKYLNMFVPTVRDEVQSREDIYNSVASNRSIPDETPFIALQKGVVVFGIKGRKIAGDSTINYFSPFMFRGDNPAAYANRVNQMLTRMFKDDFLGKMKQNMDGDAILKNRDVAHISYNADTKQSEVSSPNKYSEYLKDNLKTNTLSFDLGDGTYATFLQPVLNYKWGEASEAAPEEVKQPSIRDIVSTVAKETTGLEPTAEDITGTISEVVKAIPDLEKLGLSQEAIEALRKLSGNQGDKLFDPNYDVITDEAIRSVKSKLTKISDLDTYDRANIVRFVANEIMNQINPQRRNSIDKKELTATITKSFEDIIQPRIDLINNQREPIQKLVDTGNFPGLQSVLNDFDSYSSNADVLKQNWNYLINEAFESYISRFTGIDIKMSKNQKNVDVTILDTPETEETTEHEVAQQDSGIDTTNEREKNYSQESVEDNGKNSVSYVVKRFLAQIPEYDRQGNVKKGFMGTTIYPGFDHYYNTIGAMLTSRGDTLSDYQDMKTRLSQFQDAQPWIKEAIKRLDEGDQQLKNAFMYNFTRDGLSMKFVMHSFDRERNEHTLKVYDTNANETLRVIQNKWKENFKHSPLSLNTGEDYQINSGIAQKLLDQFNTWSPAKLPNSKEAQSWLSNFGIILSDDTMKELVTNGYYVNNEKGEPVKLLYKRMFDKSASSSGIFGRLGRYLELMTTSGVNLNYLENDSVNPYSDVSGILNKIANIEAKYVPYTTVNSFRDGTKSIYGFTPGKYVTNAISKIVSDPEVLKVKQQISYSKHSYLLDAISKDPEFASKIRVDHLGINAFRELGKSLYKDNSITSLSDPDHELTKLGMFMDQKQGNVKYTTPEGLPLRMARMFFQTMSDKSTMVDIATGVINIGSTDITPDTGVISERLNKFLFTQLIQPELERIISHYKRAYNTNSDPYSLVNQKSYNLGAQIFHLIPEANNLSYTMENGKEVKLLEFIANSGNTIDDEVKSEIINKIRPQADTLFHDLFDQLVKQKLDVWEKDGFIERDANNVIKSSKFMDDRYMKSKQAGNPEDKLKLAAYDYIINSALTNANMHMLVAGDVANYSQDKAFKGNFELDEKGRPITYRPKDPSVYSKMSSDVIGVNLGKRLALLIAPGSSLAQSKGDKYIQLYSQDRIAHSDNLPFLVQLYHGKEALAEAQSDLDKLHSDNPIEIADARKAIAKKFPDLAAYTAFESTDAQEYATGKEGLNNIYRQGRLDDETYKVMSDKLSKQSELLAKGQPIPSELFLSGEQLDLIFQPQKPVYAGLTDDIDNDMSRMDYVKSSTIFLIPQVTQAFPGLDGVRRGMEEVEVHTGKSVRLSYDTANKVGSPLSENQIRLWDDKGNYLSNAIDSKRIADNLTNNIPGPARILDRENFRIQQDVPFKSDKIDHQDTNVLGTQMMKEMFGDGISQIPNKVFDYNGKKVSGRELADIHDDLFNQWISHEKTRLYDSLGIDENTGAPIDPVKTAQKIQGILQTEAKKRGYPQQDIDALELSTTYDKDGNFKDIQFNIPLWLSPNSNRYEALLNAVVTNRLLNLKLPGNSFVVASEEGFKTPDQMPEGFENRVIFTDKWKGQLEPARYDRHGNLISAQVLVPSKLRGRDNKLLDLFSKDSQGRLQYVTKDSKGFYKLNDKIADELKQMPSYRIPTSGHMSMAHAEIVGYLPPEFGDVMVGPKNWQKQKGLDYDVDKENTYLPWHYTDEEGRVLPLERGGNTTLESYDEDYGNLTGAIDQTKDKLSSNQDINKLIRQYEDEIEVSKEYGFDSKDAKKFIKQLRPQLDYEVTGSQLKELLAYQKQFKTLKSQLLQNELIKVYNSVLGNKSPEVQQKINRVLSTDFAEKQANLISDLISKNKDSKYFTILSDEYQKYKMGLGASGKLGIGVYSNYVVFHNLVQQAKGTIRLMKYIPDPNMPAKNLRVPYSVTIGNHTSDGILGRLRTLDNSRSIAEVNAERQNTATDNEKLQIMGKTNVNDITINVDAALNILGFDKDHATIDGKRQEISIPYFLLSQPIIREYVDNMKVAKSTIAGYDPNAELDVITKLYKKYDPEDKLDFNDDQQVAELRKSLIGQKLADNIVDNGKDGVSQKAILDLFLDIKSYGDDLRALQGRLNVQRDGLGKSVFDMLGKYDNVQKLSFMPRIDGINHLIGDYISPDDMTTSDPEELKANGYTTFNLGGNDDGLAFAVKPSTFTGALVVHSAKAGHELWTKYFPFNNPSIKNVMDRIITTSSGEEVQDSKRLEMQYEISQEMKKYLFSSDKLGLFKGDPKQERERLFFDRKDNESLAAYLNRVTQVVDNNLNPAKDLLVNNKLIGRLQYTLNKGKLPSIIKFDNSKGEDFNEEYKYLALVELLEKNAKLPDYNNMPYTTRQLGKDMINYAYLEGGIQEAIQYVKYIPVQLLKEIGFSDTTQLWQRAANGELVKDSQGNQIDIWRVMLGANGDRFVRQYFQHNPQRLPKISTDNIGKNSVYSGTKKLENLTSFEPKGLDEPKSMVAIYNPFLKSRTGSNFQIYESDGRAYNRIPTLGTFGMSEYSIKSDEVKPLIDNGREPVNISPDKPIALDQDKIIQNTTFNLNEGHLGNTIKSIADASITGYSELANLMGPYLKNDTKLDIGAANNGRSRGEYLNNKITIDEGFLNHEYTTDDQIAQTVLHEAAHSILDDRLSQYFDNKGQLKVAESELPEDVMRLHRVFQQVAKELGTGLDEFKQWYQTHPGELRNNSAEERFLYAGTNIHEMAAMVLSEPDILRQMSEIKYQSGKSLLERFVDAIKRVFEAVGIKFNEDSTAHEALSSVLSLLNNDSKPIEIKENKLDLSKEDQQAISPFGKIITPSNDEKLDDLLRGITPPDQEDNPLLSPDQRRSLPDECLF